MNKPSLHHEKGRKFFESAYSAPVRRSGSRADQHKPKPTASAWGSGTAQRLKANPTKGGKATTRLGTEEEHRPDLREVTQQEK